MAEQRRQHTPNQRLRQAREARNWTQLEVADALGTTKLAVGRWERGERIPRRFYWTQLCELFGKTPVELGLLADPTEEHDVQDIPEAAVSHYWNVPYRRNLFFTGRDEVLHQLHDALSLTHPAMLHPSWAISGLGGIGKTQTAIEYAYRYAQDYMAIFWISAETNETLISSIVAIAEQLNILEKQEQNQEKKVAVVIDWLISHHNWLLIFDNVEDATLLKPFLPCTPQGAILLTTRLHTLEGLAYILELPTFTLEEGRQFLLWRTRPLHLLPPLIPTSAPSSEWDALATTLVEKMGGLPLALDQAGAYIERTRCSLTEYAQLFQQGQFALLKERSLVADHPSSVIKTFLLSFEHLKQNNTVAADVLQACVYLYPDAMDEELVLEVAVHLNEALSFLKTDALAWNTHLAHLQASSLLRRDPETRILTMHRLIQVALRAQIDRSIVRHFLQQTVQVISALFPSVEDIVTWSRCHHLLPHAILCATYIEQEGISSVEAGWLLHQLGAYLLEQARYEQAEHWIKKALAIRHQVLGSQHPEIAATLNNLAELFFIRGAYEQAEPLYLQALTIRRHHLGENHLAVATSLNNLAGIYTVKEDYEQAEALYTQALHIREAELGTEHLDVAETLHNLGFLFFQQYQYARTRPLYYRAWVIYEQVLGGDHVYLVTILNSLGRLSFVQGHYAEAASFYQRALEICERGLPFDHPHLAITYRNQGELQCMQGYYARAEALYQQGLEIREKVQGPEHPRTLQIRYDLAQLYSIQGHYSQAKQMYQHLLALCEKTLGNDHPETRRIQESFRLLLKQMRRKQEAL